MKNIFLILQLIFGILLTGSSFAQIESKLSNPLSKSMLFSLEGGSNYSFTDYETSDFGFSFGGGLEYYFPTNNISAIGLKLNLAQVKFSGSENNLGLPNIYDTNVRKMSLGITYAIAANNHILPFLALSGSYLWLSYDSENIQSRFFEISNGGDKNSLQLEVIGGIKFKITDIFDINFGLGYNQVLKDNIDAIKYGEHQDFYFSGNLGVSFRIWSEKDSDGDGILDDEDNCPFVEEDFDGFEDEDGCPDYDNDGDGILDVDDDCQFIAEDKDGFEDEDGCPDLDNDGDGIPDLDDSCPNVKEDFDGYQDQDGCPDADNDGDGILDDVDNCIDKAEVFNGYLDDDGCPDELPEPIYVEPEPKVEKKVTVPKKPKPIVPSAPSSFLIHSETTFNSNTDQIKSSAYSELNRIANELKKYPNTLWRIEGHIDKQNSRLDANRITKSQADAILQYFISRGLSASKFESVGFGDATPISSNTSVYGRMKNRRIIIRKLK